MFKTTILTMTIAISLTFRQLAAFGRDYRRVQRERLHPGKCCAGLRLICSQSLPSKHDDQSFFEAFRT
jgi:hypothetical protein